MKYDFITTVNRSTHGSNKWNSMYKANPNVSSDIIPFSVADMEFKNAPEIIDGLKKLLDERLLGYASATDEYYEAVINWMDRRHHWHVEKDWIVTTPGVVVALRYLVKTLCQPEDGVIVLTPVYHMFYSAIKNNQCRVVDCPLMEEDGRYTIDFEDLKKKAEDPKNTLIILCSPHNPVGRVWTKEELTEIAEICIKNNVKIISDEIHHDLIMKGYQHTVMASINPKYEDYIVTCTSCSKTFSLAGLKVANTIIKNPEIREAFVKQLSAAGFGGLTNMAYQGCISAYNDAEGWLEECLEVIYENATYLKNYIEEKMPELKAIPLEGTYLQWLDFRGLSVSLDELKVQLTKHDLYFNDGAVFGENGAYFQRINLACPKVVLEKAMDRLYDMVKELRHE